MGTASSEPNHPRGPGALRLRILRDRLAGLLSAAARPGPEEIAKKSAESSGREITPNHFRHLWLIASVSGSPETEQFLRVYPDLSAKSSETFSGLVRIFKQRLV